MSDVTTVGVILARMDSSRLPGKPLRMVGDLPLLGHVLRRAGSSRMLSRMIVATTRRAVDDPLVDFANTSGVEAFRGDCDDVALRALECAESCGAKQFVRLNGDSPFPDATLIDQGISEMVEGVHFFTNIPGRTFPYGVSVEILDTAFFRQAWSRFETTADREHVTSALYRSLDRIVHRERRSPHPELHHARLVVDTEADRDEIERLVRRLGPNVHRAGYAAVARLWLEMHAGRPVTTGHDCGSTLL